MKNLLIIGARGFGREVYNLAVDCINKGLDICIKGFLDDKSDALDGYNNYPPIVSTVEDYEIQKDDVFICALGDVLYKRKYSEYMLQKGAEFISLIHPSVRIGMNTHLGTGCIIRTQADISCDVKIGDFVTIMGYSILGHDARVGNYCHLGAHTFMGGYSILEDQVTLHPNVKVMPHKKVGSNSIMGIGSIVMTNIKPNITAFGSPAKKITV
ncbi:MAG: acetyltransferase [Bacteroidaceae bacterium]|nr:acetyltransferase [Bacteroidaceae bacterium]